jgi:flagellar biosynthesis/type III secretory pathway protein FliH
MIKILLNVEGFGEVEVVKETSLEKGSCVVETKFGTIDGGIKTRMKQVEQEVYKILNR